LLLLFVDLPSFHVNLWISILRSYSALGLIDVHRNALGCLEGVLNLESLSGARPVHVLQLHVYFIYRVVLNFLLAFITLQFVLHFLETDVDVPGHYQQSLLLGFSEVLEQFFV
jgi:hypothetical protein